MRATWLLCLLLAAPVGLPAQALPPRSTAVLVHGAWGGGWDWKGVERELRTRGWNVYRPTLTGLGERHHLASPEIGLATHVADVANTILWERLENVVLVGHSYGGMVITGVAERVPDRIRRLVYVDAVLPFDGECVASVLRLGEGPCGDVGSMQGEKGGLVAAHWVAPDTPPPHDVAQPARTLVDPIELAGDPGHGLPATYVLTRDTAGKPDRFETFAERAGALGWSVRELVADHNPQRTMPGELADLIVADPSADPDGGAVGEAWIDLFDGETLDGWTVKLRGHEVGDNYASTFRVEDGMIRVRYDGYQEFGGRFGHLYFDRPFSRYRLAFEYRFVGRTMPDAPDFARLNSGVMIHAQDPRTMPVDQDWPVSLEFQLLAGQEPGESRPTGNVCTPGTRVEFEGRLDERHCIESSSPTYPKDRWVRAEILVLGDSLVRHMVEGETVMEYRHPRIDGTALTEGYIALQAEGQEIDFRRIRLLNLGEPR